MKRCLWCLKEEGVTQFLNQAHTIPKSLGGKDINPNICDSCNSYFGNRNAQDRISVEEILKETFCITRERIQESTRQINPNKKGRFKSRFFEIRTKNGKPKLRIKSAFKLKKGFQRLACRYFKRAIYKLFLEELNRQTGVGYEEKYNFIREFARYNIGEYPLLYFERKVGALLLFSNEGETPIVIFDRMNYLCSEFGFSEFEFLGHVFGFPARRLFELEQHLYIRESLRRKQKFFSKMKSVKFLTDIDLTLSIMDR